MATIVSWPFEEMIISLFMLETPPGAGEQDGQAHADRASGRAAGEQQAEQQKCRGGRHHMVHARVLCAPETVKGVTAPSGAAARTPSS
jgi:hypothetical protein